MCHQAGVTVQAKGELGQVVRADREAVEILQELLGEQGIGRDLAHHDQLQIVCATLEAVLGEQIDDARRFVEVAHEGNHDLDVGQPELVTHLLHRRHFHLEAITEGVGNVTRGAAETEHRVLFFGLVDFPAQQLAIFVRLEVRHAHDDGLGVEGCGNGGHAFDQLLDEELLRCCVTTRTAIDLVTQAGRHLAEVEDRLRMDADHVVDDELETRETHPLVGDLCELEGELGVAHVHHDLDWNLGQIAHVGGDDLELQLAAVHIAGVAFGAGHGDRFTLMQDIGRIAATHDRRNAQLARDDGSVAGAPATVGDDGGGTLHHRLPVGIGHVGDEHVARLHAVHLGSVTDHAHHAGTDLLADGTPVGHGLAVLLETVLFHHQTGVLTLHGLRTRLQDVELAVVAILAPLDVHRAAVVLLDDDRVAGELEHILVAERETVAVSLGHVDGAHGLARHSLVGEDHLDQLGAQVAADDRRFAQRQRGLVYVELVRVDRALHHGLAQTERGGDEHHLIEAGLGIDREHHPRGPGVRTHHALHAGRERDVGMGEVLVHAVSDGPVVVQRRKHLLHRMQDVLVAVDVEESLLLASEGGVRQVFGGGRRAHGETALAFCGNLVVSGLYFGCKPVRERQLDDPFTNLRTGFDQGIDIIDIERVKRGVDTIGEAIVSQELTVGICGGRKAARHTHVGRQLADHLAKRGVLAADLVDVGHAQFVEWDHIASHG